MVFHPKQYYYQTNPIAAICEYYDVDWDEGVHMFDWNVPYGITVSHTLDDRRGKPIHVSLYRMASGSYEALAYHC